MKHCKFCFHVQTDNSLVICVNGNAFQFREELNLLTVLVVVACPQNMLAHRFEIDMTGQTDKTDRQDRQTDRTNGQDRRTRQTDGTDRQDRSDRQDRQDTQDTQDRQTDQTGQTDRQTGCKFQVAGCKLQVVVYIAFSYIANISNAAYSYIIQNRGP